MRASRFRRTVTRREAMAGMAAAAVSAAAGTLQHEEVLPETPGMVMAGTRMQPQNFQSDGGAMRITCFIRYQIDPFQKDEFRKYAENWGRIIPRCGGKLLGYFLPHEGTNDIAWGLIGFESLAAYEAYRARLKGDAEARANFAMAENKRLIVREERTFLEAVEETLGARSSSGGKDQ